MQTILDQKSSNNPYSAPRIVSNWLIAGLILVFVQVIIGGITRLTDSGLSITEWEVIKGTLPPIGEDAWKEAFEKYKTHAYQQFKSLHADMTLSEFKFIYFWEWFHRFWARMMGFVFIIPLTFFMIKKWISKKLLVRLAIMFLLAGLAGVFGWIMVASGLNDDSRTWVSAYKLVMHLGIATVLFAYIFWTFLLVRGKVNPIQHEYPSLKKWAWIFFVLLMFQILWGGLMAGMRAGLLHPYFPFFIKGENMLAALSETSQINLNAVIDYEPNRFIKGVVQMFHRSLAYILTAIGVFLFIKTKDSSEENLKSPIKLLLACIIIQFILGVMTVINCIGSVPVVWGAIHQGMALILLIASLNLCFKFRK